MQRSRRRSKMIGLFLCLVCVAFSANGAIISQSSITACDSYGEEILNSSGSACRKKMLVAVTVTGDEGKAQYIEAVVSRVFDDTQNKNAQLKSPIRIRINKSPVINHYSLYQVGYVNHEPYEEMVTKKTSRCRDDWYSQDNEAACGFKYENGERVFDSQGFCCSCSMGGSAFYRGADKKCNGARSGDFGHCLKFSPLYHYVFGLYPPQLIFDITVTIEQANGTNTSKVWTNIVEDLKIGPQRTIVKSQNYSVNVQYIADFYSSSFEPSLANKFLLVPDLDKLKGAPASWLSDSQKTGLLDSLKNASERLLVPKDYTDFSGFSCDKIGVYYTAFRDQGTKCNQHFSSCLKNQPASLWAADKTHQLKGKKGSYMAYNYGKVYSVPDSKGIPRFELNFVSQTNKVSLIAITMEADSIKFVDTRSSGRIVEAHLNTFQALSSEGVLVAVIQNTGHLTATYHVSVSECSAGIDMITSKVQTLNPFEIANCTFQVHSFFSVGRINHCIVELYDNGARMLDNLTVQFQTEDTCFCYGHCGCACGSNRTDCPPPPTYLKSANYSGDIFRGFSTGFDKAGKWFKETLDSGTLGTSIVVAIIVLLVIGLGALKVVLVVYTGKLNLPAVPGCTRCCCGIASACGECLKIGLRNLRLDFILCCTQVLPGGGKGGATAAAQVAGPGSGWVRPAHCNGACGGARWARKEHRKLLRKHERRSLADAPPTVWWESPYTCTCAVRESVSMCEICGGVFFFFYCPLLPLWWSLGFLLQHTKKAWRRYRRRKQFQAQQAEKRAGEEKAYLALDKYVKGGVKEFVDFNATLKRGAKEKAESAAEELASEAVASEGGDPAAITEVGAPESYASSEESEQSRSDSTSEDDGAIDLSELLDVRELVYFNYSGMTPTSAPTSLRSPGENFSIKGKLMALGEGNYTFELGKYTSQMVRVVKGVPKSLRSPHEMMGAQFEKRMDEVTVMRLITLHPLYTCLNDT